MKRAYYLQVTSLSQLGILSCLDSFNLQHCNNNEAYLSYCNMKDIHYTKLK
jgi:hypothetical protein